MTTAKASPITASRPGVAAAIRGVAVAAFLSLLAALVAGAQAGQVALLATALAAGTAWLGLEAFRTPGPPRLAVLVLAVGATGLITVPGLLLAADPGVMVGGTRASLRGGLLLHVAALFAVLTGLAATRRLPLDALTRRIGQLERGEQPRTPRAARGWLAGVMIGVASLGLFLAAAGGPARFFANLDQTGASTAGLTYLIWLILLVKFATFAELGERWRRGDRCGRTLACGLVLALVVVALIGTRLLLVVALAQLVLLAVTLRGTSRQAITIVVAATVLAAVTVVGLGELRRWQSLPQGTPFGTYLVQTGLPELPRTYVNQYADGVRVAVLARGAVPELAPFEHGKELLRVVAQPIPGGLRPPLPRPPALEAVFKSGNGAGNALPLPVVGYLQLGIAGAVLAGLLLGAIVALVDRGLRATRDPGLVLAFIGAVTGAVMILRGSLPQATAFALMDVIGFFFAHRVLCSGEGAFGLVRSRAPTSRPLAGNPAG